MSLAVTDLARPLDDVRARFRDLGLEERPAGTSWFYALADGRLLLILSPMGRGAQVYLYPQALGRPPGSAQWLYAALEAADFGMGSKLGPSIGLPLEDEARMALFWSGFARLLAGDGGAGTASR